MGVRDTVANPKKLKTRTPKQNKNLRNSQFMPPHPEIPGGGVGKKITEEDFLNVFAKKKKGGVKNAKSLLTSN